MWDKYYRQVCRLTDIAHEMEREVTYCVRRAADYQLEAVTAMSALNTTKAKRELELARLWNQLADSINSAMRETVLPQANEAIELAKSAI